MKKATGPQFNMLQRKPLVLQKDMLFAKKKADEFQPKQVTLSSEVPYNENHPLYSQAD